MLKASRLAALAAAALTALALAALAAALALARARARARARAVAALVAVLSLGDQREEGEEGLQEGKQGQDVQQGRLRKNQNG